MSEPKNKKEINALISLLDEPNRQIYERIEEKILHHGMEAMPSLRKISENSFDDLIQSRVQSIKHQINFDHIFRELSKWAASDQQNLMEAYITLSKYRNPDLNTDEIKEKIESITRDAWLELNNHLTALEKVKVLNHIIFDIHKFKGNKSNIHDPDNFYLNDLLETKKGNPLSMSILYMIIARELTIPLFGVDLPHHFVLAYVDEYIEGRITIADEENVLFYINPYSRGAVFTNREINIFIKQLNLKPKDDYYNPCENKLIIRRMIENLAIAYDKMGDKEKSSELKSLIKAVI